MFSKSFSKNNFKIPLNSIKIIALVGASSMLLTNLAIAQELNTTTKIPISSTVNYAPARQVPTGYVKGNYKTVAIPDKKTKKVNTPLANELSLQEAAEIAAQELFRLYDVKLTTQTLEMFYYPKSNQKTSEWSISVYVTPEYFFDIFIDATTGEISGLLCQGGPTINSKFPDSEDPKTIGDGLSLANKGLTNPDEACAKIKTLLTQKGFITEPIETIEYTDSIYHTACAVATPYSAIDHAFTITTTSKKTYNISVSQDLSTVTSFFIA